MSPADGSGVLAGRSVLITGPSDLGRRLADALAARGATVELSPFLRVVPAAARPWREALAQLVDGGFDWLVVTSMATARVLRSLNVVVPPETRIAAVGPATARGLVHEGFDVSLVPAEHSVRGLLADPTFATTSGSRILLPESELATPILADGLREQGHDVTAIVAYRIEGVPAPPYVVQRLRSGGYDALVLGSVSTGTQVVRQAAPISEQVRIVAVGPTTAEAAAESGLHVQGWGVMREPESLADAVEAVLQGRWIPPEPGTATHGYHDNEE